jgi:hypothetical protein
MYEARHSACCVFLRVNVVTLESEVLECDFVIEVEYAIVEEWVVCIDESPKVGFGEDTITSMNKDKHNKSTTSKELDNDKRLFDSSSL